MERYLCIHGHFYQPPRENPWLEAVELQESAYPYHDWNDRITDECYAANARSRILDGEGRIARIVNNYEHMSFNFGPTLLSWMEEERPDVYQMILEADRASVQRFNGHGNAIAQGYGHIILPLSNDRDRRTQVAWGIRDFEERFGRKPEGMWLPETAANTESLEALAEQGIRYTILAPRQARAIRTIGEEKWTELNGSGIDPSRAYLCRLPSGKEINLFFYDGPVSQAVAFEKLLDSGEKFAARLRSALDEQREWPQLVHIATDGETYGHHHRHGDMALAHALSQIESGGIELTNYGAYLEKHPPTHEAQIVENSSWSCVHGVERWRSNCGCSSGMNGGWTQEWRAPLRAALDWLRDALIPRYESAAAALLKDPWGARDAYIDIVLDRSRENVDRFLSEHATGALSDGEKATALKLLELQRNAMLMYTSCGWFFDELSGIETVQVTKYAARVLQLARHALGEDLEPEFQKRLEGAKSNVPAHQNGAWIYEHLVKPTKVDLRTVGVHFAIQSLFEPAGEQTSVYAYDAKVENAQRWTAGRAKMLVGRATLTSRITLDSETLTFGVLHLGDHILNGGVRAWRGEEAYNAFVERARSGFEQADFAAIIRAMDEAFEGSSYGLRNLFKDEQRVVMERVLEATMKEVEAGYRQIYSNHAPLMRFLASIRFKAPEAMVATGKFVLDATIRRGLRPWAIDLDRVRTALREADEQAIELDRVSIGFDMDHLLDALAGRLEGEPMDIETLRLMRDVAAIAREEGFEVRSWKPTNLCYVLAQEELPRRRAAGAGEQDREWAGVFVELAGHLNVRVD